MATLPRFQQMGIQYADLPRVSTAGIEAGARSYDVLGQSLDRMIDFAYQRQVTAAEKKAKQYAIDFPPTKDQLQEAVKTGQFPKIQGAGDIFQRTYESTASQLLAAELQFNVAERAASWQKRAETEAVDPAAVRAHINDMLDGYASVLSSMNPDVALKFRAGNTALTHNVYRQVVDAADKRNRLDIKNRVTRSVDNQRSVVKAIIANAGDVSPDTGEPVSIADQLAVIENVYLDYSRIVGDNEPLEAFKKMVEEETIESLAMVALQPEFAANDFERADKVDRGNFGVHQQVWDTLSPDSKKKVRDRLNGRLESLSKARTAFFNSENDLADALERRIYLSQSGPERRQLFNAMQQLAISPAQLSRVKDFIVDGGGGAKVDDLKALSSLLRRADIGDLSVDEVITARNSGRITNATARSLAVDLSSPNKDVSAAKGAIRASSIIEREGMPQIISDADARSAALLAENSSVLELMEFARTPKADGTLPTSAEIRTKGNQLAQDLRRFSAPYMNEALQKMKTNLSQTIPELAGVDIMDDRAVEQVFAARTAKNGEADRQLIITARTIIRQYRELNVKAEQR